MFAVLADGPRSGGRHVVTVPTQRLAPGAYHCVLKALDKIETRSVVVRR
jgi:hypothetical protein